MRIPPDLARAIRDIMPTDDYQIKAVKRLGDKTYKVEAEDSDYICYIEVYLLPHGEHILLNFDFEEKRK